MTPGSEAPCPHPAEALGQVQLVKSALVRGRREASARLTEKTQGRVTEFPGQPWGELGHQLGAGWGALEGGRTQTSPCEEAG